MGTKQRVEKLVEDLGCTLEDTGHSLNVDAPCGKTLECGLHHFCCAYGRLAGDATKTGAWEDMLERLQFVQKVGLSDCDDPECELCHPELYPELREYDARTRSS